MSVAGAVINADGRLLAICRADNGHWEPPGGVLELHETIEEGVIREVREETGLTVQPERLSGVYKNIKRGVVALVFRCAPTQGTTSTDNAETRDVAWLTPEEVKARMDPAYAVRLLDAISLDPTIAVRTHDGTNLC